MGIYSPMKKSLMFELKYSSLAKRQIKKYPDKNDIETSIKKLSKDPYTNAEKLKNKSLGSSHRIPILKKKYRVLYTIFKKVSQIVIDSIKPRNEGTYKKR